MGLMGFFDHFGGFILTLSKTSRWAASLSQTTLLRIKQVIDLNQTESRMSTYGIVAMLIGVVWRSCRFRCLSDQLAGRSLRRTGNLQLHR